MKKYCEVLIKETCKNKYLCLLTTDLKYFELSRNITTIFYSEAKCSTVLTSWTSTTFKCSFRGSFIEGWGNDKGNLTWLSSQMKDMARKAIQKLDSWNRFFFKKASFMSEQLKFIKAWVRILACVFLHVFQLSNKTRILQLQIFRFQCNDC